MTPSHVPHITPAPAEPLPPACHAAHTPVTPRFMSMQFRRRSASLLSMAPLVLVLALVATTRAYSTGPPGCSQCVSLHALCAWRAREARLVRRREWSATGGRCWTRCRKKGPVLTPLPPRPLSFQQAGRPPRQRPWCHDVVRPHGMCAGTSPRRWWSGVTPRPHPFYGSLKDSHAPGLLRTGPGRSHQPDRRPCGDADPGADKQW
jgi:hypothetical protein